MGVPGLWDILRLTGQVRSLTHLAVESGFVANAHGHRAYRIGIDASIWFFHAQGGREGENPELRTLFFRCCRLMAMPFLPIFVFDGPKRPKIKRGKAVGGKEHWMVNSLRTMLDAFGFECRTAPGEAEAELAYLNRAGFIDAVLSDDVDCFLFGAHTVIRNSSATLSGNKTHGARNADGKEDGQHVNIYRADDLLANPAVLLSKGGLILIALLRGGDYDQHGIDGCGVSTAHALARAGFGDTLLAAALSPMPGELTAFLPTWRTALRHELRTNASGLAPRRCPALAQRIPEDFPALDVLRCYTHPVTSEVEGARGLDGLWRRRPDVAKVAHVCEMYFEWGVEQTIVKRFRGFLWPGAVLRALLHAALDKDRRHGLGVGTPSKRNGDGPEVETPSKAIARTLGGMALHADSEPELVTAIQGERRHASTDHILEYRLEIHPEELVKRARAGVQGLRLELADSAAAGEDEDDEEEDEDGKKKRGPKTPPPDPDSKLRLWMPAVMVTYAYPGLVEEFEERQAAKKAKKAKKGTGKCRTKAGRDNEEKDESTPAKPAKSKAKGKPSKARKEGAEEDESDDGRPLMKAKAPIKLKTGPSKRDVQPPAKKSSAASASSSKSGSQSLMQLMDQEPFLVSFVPAQPKLKSKTKPRPAIEEEEEPSPPRPMLTPCPFPMSLDDLFGGSPPIPTRTRKHSTTSASALDLDMARARLKKSPRKSEEHTSPRKPPRVPPPSPRKVSPSPSPSPARPLLRAKMKPLQMAVARSAASVAGPDVIVISSDSDVPAPRPKVKIQRAASTARSRRGPVKPALSSSNMNLDHDSDVIDLT